MQVSVSKCHYRIRNAKKLPKKAESLPVHNDEAGDCLHLVFEIHDAVTLGVCRNSNIEV